MRQRLQVLNRPVRAVVFDLDNTLIDSFAGMIAISTAVLRDAGHDAPTAEYFETAFRHGLRLDVVFDAVTGIGLEASEVLVEEYRRRFLNEALADIPILPTTVETLRALRAAGIPMAVATSKARRMAKACLEVTGLDAFLPVLVAHDDVAHGKPAPDMILTACTALGVDPSDALMVGDAVVDIEMGQAAGAQTCAMVAQPVGRDAVLAAGPDLAIDRLDALLPALGRMR